MFDFAKDMDKDRKPYDTAVRKLKGNLGSVFVLSQDELLALHEAEEERLGSYLNMTPEAADDFRWLCFDIASQRDEEKDKLDYLELGRKAIEYEQNKVKAGSQDGVNCSETLPLGNLSIKGDPIKEDPSKEVPSKDLIKTLNPKLEVDLGALMTLTEEEYQDLLKDNRALLKELNIPKQSVEDAARFCEEQQASLKKKRELVKFYEEDRRLLEVS
ncbi:hypothetical protein BSL78_24998 [Apostichopus japonicus]|uniref:DNA fragmentation factor 45kDa middle domain-containing protein n=1 Tax=Stichopus japonicus TaxID=307972 RepID=A0A2G8JR10_STIJA|nr:hypothetical protein BSL78_24998 [Apostichopus japonicus]